GFVAVCPVCSGVTDSLKRFEVVHLCFFFGFLFVRPAVHTACPRCMRRYLWRRCLVNVIPANLCWPVWILPRTLVQVALTYSRGPSRSLSATGRVRPQWQDAGTANEPR